MKWEVLTGVGEGKIVLMLFEPRWHGFARWRLQQEIPVGTAGAAVVCPIKQGWWRPPRQWQYAHFEIPQSSGSCSGA